MSGCQTQNKAGICLNVISSPLTEAVISRIAALAAFFDQISFQSATTLMKYGKEQEVWRLCSMYPLTFSFQSVAGYLRGSHVLRTRHHMTLAADFGYAFCVNKFKS